MQLVDGLDYFFVILMQATLPTERATVVVDSQYRDLLENRLEEINLYLRLNSFYSIPQNDDQSATSRLFPLSATIDTISINFVTIKTSFIRF